MQLRHAALTDAGRTRDHNEDSYGVDPGDERAEAGALFVVCDGVGGIESGEVASELAVDTILRAFAARPAASAKTALQRAFQEANGAVWKQGHGKMGTTGVAALFRDAGLVIANVGDCRAYLVRDGHARQLTRDHSFVAEQVAAGTLTEAQARLSSYRHVITRALGQRPDLEVDLFHEPLRQDDIVVLCSDGLHGQVEPHEIALAVTRVGLDEACRALVRLANERGGPDNITLVVIQVVELDGTGAAAGQTARLDTAVPTARTARLASPAPTTRGPKGTERLVSAAPRRQPASTGQPAGSAYDSAAVPGGVVRSFVLWMAGLLLLAALLIGGYAYFVVGGPTGSAPETSSPTPAAPPTQTPPGEQPTPTLVPTPTPA